MLIVLLRLSSPAFFGNLVGVLVILRIMIQTRLTLHKRSFLDRTAPILEPNRAGMAADTTGDRLGRDGCRSWAAYMAIVSVGRVVGAG